jgi:hypothetical protein
MAGSPRATALGRINGPPANPNSLRSAKLGAEWTRIPSNARADKETPDWPAYVPEPSDEELALWIDLWRKPQATLWIRDQNELQVAMYCRLFISSMQPGGFVTEKTAAERMAGSLLLTTPALLAAKVRIVDPEEEPAPESTPAGTPVPISSASSVRDRFTVVTPAADDVSEDEYESGTSDD